MLGIDILDSGYLEKKDLACSWWVRLFKFISHFFAHPENLPPNFIALHQITLVGLSIQRKLHGIENNFICWTCGLKSLVFIQIMQADSWQKELAPCKQQSQKESLERISKLNLRRPQSSTNKLSLQRYGSTLYREMPCLLQFQMAPHSNQNQYPMKNSLLFRMVKKLHIDIFALSLKEILFRASSSINVCLINFKFCLCPTKDTVGSIAPIHSPQMYLS